MAERIPGTLNYPSVLYHWPVEAVDYLREQWLYGSASDHAREINKHWPHPRASVTRNAVIAKGRKLMLPTKKGVYDRRSKRPR